MDTLRQLIIKALEAVAHSIETNDTAAIHRLIADIRKDMQEKGRED